MAAGSREICGQLLRHRRLMLAVIVAVLMYELVCTEYADVLCRAVVCTLFAVPAAVLDSIYGKLYHRLSFCLAASGLLLALAQGMMWGETGSVFWSMAGGSLFCLLMLIVFVLSRGSMGFGDVCFSAGLGTFIPFEYIPLAFFLTFMLGGGGAVLVYVAGAARIREPVHRMPLGPFLAAACLLSILHGRELMGWYTGAW